MSGPRPPKSLRGMDGDWPCPDENCGNMNFARRTQYRPDPGGGKHSGSSRFKESGLEIGKQMAEKSKGLFSAEDWQCGTCGNVNWARRKDCNICSAPRFTKMESRTGFGGGFMEREEVVDYIKRDESDDEFDEFGRKKKKFRGKVPDVPSIIPAAPTQPASSADKEDKRDEEEDDEEEDDDDFDESKYKFSDDEDTVPDQSADTSEKVNSAIRKRSRSPRSRSRSRSRGRSRSPRRRGRSRSRSGSREKHRRRRSRSRD